MNWEPELGDVSKIRIFYSSRLTSRSRVVEVNS